MRPDIVKLDMSLIDGDNADHIASTTGLLQVWLTVVVLIMQPERLRV